MAGTPGDNTKAREAIEKAIERRQDAEQNIADRPAGLSDMLIEQLRYVLHKGFRHGSIPRDDSRNPRPFRNP